MTLTIDLPPELEDRLKTEARRQGVAPEAYAMRLIQEQLPPALGPTSSAPETTLYPGTNSLAELFRKWEIEDRTDDPDEIARRQREWEKLKQALNANHDSDRKPFP